MHGFKPFVERGITRMRLRVHLEWRLSLGESVFFMEGKGDTTAASLGG